MNIKKKSSVKKFILIFLSLHTAIVALFVCFMLRGGILPDGLPLAIILALFSAALTAYTGYRIFQLVCHEIAAAMKVVCSLSDHLKSVSEKLCDNAKAIEQRAVLVNNCANTITELVKGMDPPDDDVSS